MSQPPDIELRLGTPEEKQLIELHQFAVSYGMTVTGRFPSAPPIQRNPPRFEATKKLAEQLRKESQRDE